ncbi:transcriptional regulator [Escherichia coli]|nr:transcriptional regulator [Escherichia coli]MXI05735.1 transcriptional regulator [Escherichia coli]MXI23777.1 transcriptional regulator [Escherichia coli]MXI95000.1 transcriptional regulator [Escherichia coli]MXJ20338.1 transcriptional regulator [Escherichia coli]
MNDWKKRKRAGLASLYSWKGDLVPEGRAMRLQEASGGELQYDPKVYDEYRKTKRAGRLNNENHS